MAFDNPLFNEEAGTVYNAIEMRQWVAATMTAGVRGVADFAVTPGVGLTLNVAAGAAAIDGTDAGGQGRYFVANPSATNGVDLDPPPGSNSRIDAVYVKNNDTVYGGPDNLPVIGVEPGTPAADPDPPAIPATSLLLAWVVVPDDAVDSTEYTIIDKRVAAKYGGYRGASYRTEELLATSALDGATKVMELEIPAQGIAYRIRAGACLRVLVTGAAGLYGGMSLALALSTDAYPAGRRGLIETSIVRWDLGSVQAVYPKLNDVLIDVAAGGAVTLEAWATGAGGGLTWTPSDIADAQQYIDAVVEPL